MKRFFFLGLFLAITTLTAMCQQQADPVIFEIGGKPIYKSEFMKNFLSSIGKDVDAPATACTWEKRQELESFAELFVNFRTLLADAYARGYDTLPSLVKELKGYRDELAAPYLIDSATMTQLLKEAYERNKWSLHAVHILVKCRTNASPADTLAAYKEALGYYERVMGGEDFMTVAKEANEIRFKREMVPPDDPRRRDNGDLGNFSVFEMVYPFENAVYALEPGQISKPVRTSFGYHVVKLLSKSRFCGKTTFQHIWCASNTQEGYAEFKAREAYEKIKNGANFNAICRDYSDDQSTAENGGLLSDLTVRQMPSEYIEHLANMQPGEVSEPFETSYGWHILLLRQKDSLPSYEDMAPYYKQRMTRDIRSQQPKEKFIEQCKQKYTFLDYTKMYMKKVKGQKEPQALASLSESRTALSDSLFVRRWHFNDTMVSDMRPLFSIGDREYTAVDFLKYIEANQHAGLAYDLDVYLNKSYDAFVKEMVFEYADSKLESENVEFGELIEKYRNELMIFSYKDDMIWTKALLDTVGFTEYYNVYSKMHSIDKEEDAPYFWNERAKVTVVRVDDSSYMIPSKAVKTVNKATKRRLTRGQLYDVLNDAMGDSATFKVEEKMIEDGKQEMLSKSEWKVGVYVKPLAKGYEVIRVDGFVAPCLKSIKEARGYYINDYQMFLEQQLIEKLRREYDVMIHQDVIDEITY